MSHIAVLKILISDLDALGRACEHIGTRLVLGQKKFKTYGTTPGSADHTITIPGNKNAYEIGVKQNKGNSYSLMTDFYAGGHGLEAVVGRNAVKLECAYQREMALKHLPSGFQLTETMEEDGTLVMEAVR